ncbi:MAG: hypothetical protein ACYDHH_21695 [Solirubrobacteraceae bacterium]
MSAHARTYDMGRLDGLAPDFRRCKASVEPVLLNPATGSTPAQNYSWNWEIALDKLRIPWCAYTAPHATMDDIQTSGEYLTYAIRTIYAMAGRKIAIMGQSQGGMSMRWRCASGPTPARWLTT